MIRTLRDRLICFVYNSMGRLPFAWGARVGRLLSRLIYALNTRQVRVIRKNLYIAFPDLNNTEREQLTRKCLFENTTTMLQIPRVWRNIDSLLEQPAFLRMHNMANLEEARNSTEGAVLITPHLGNWELFGLYLAKHLDLMILYKPHAIECLRRMTEAARASTGGKLATTDAKGLRAMLRHLRHGGFVGLLPDQIPSRSNGVFAPFFSFPAYTSTLTGTLAQRHKVPIYIGYALRQSDHFELRLEKIAEPIGEYNEEETATLINRYIESVVHRCPEQYNWSYKRFRYCPAGVENPYKNLQ